MSDFEEAVRLLCEARRNGPTLDALPASAHPETLDDAHAIQSATAARLGDTIAGWKVAVMPDGRVSRGAILGSRVVADGATIAAALVPLLGVESEIAFRFDRDLPERVVEYTYAEVADAVTALMAIEVVDSRFRGYPNAPMLDRVADCMSNGAFVCGAALPTWRDVDLTSLDVELRFDGHTVVRRIGGHVAKDPLLPALALVNDLRTRGGVHVGRIITTGTYTGLNFAKPGQAVESIFHGVGSVRVRFDGAA